jgi:hypothetical protein
MRFYPSWWNLPPWRDTYECLRNSSNQILKQHRSGIKMIKANSPQIGVVTSGPGSATTTTESRSTDESPVPDNTAAHGLAGKDEGAAATPAREMDSASATSIQHKWTHEHWTGQVEPAILNEARKNVATFWSAYGGDSQVGSTTATAEKPATTGKSVKSGKSVKTAPSAKTATPPKKGAETKEVFPEGRRLEDVVHAGKKLLDSLEDMDQDLPKLKAYRGMDAGDAEKIINWSKKKVMKDDEEISLKDDVENFIKNVPADMPAGVMSTYLKKNDRKPESKTNLDRIMPVKKHLGDLPQARKFGNPPSSALVEFTLKPGADQLLFTPEYVAMPRTGNGTNLSMAVKFEQEGKVFPEASHNEGVAPGYIGLKSEQGGPFSLSLGDNAPSKLLFQLFTEEVKLVNTDGTHINFDGTPVADNEPGCPDRNL